MKKNLLVLTLCAGALLMTGCASKKDLQNCQSENQRLSSEYQNAKETIAAPVNNDANNFPNFISFSP